MNLSASHQTIIRLINKLGENFDAHELIWSRFINTHGHPGRNIPNDLHCEHLNRSCKTAVKGLGVNKTQQCITRVARAIGTIAPVLDNFDSDNWVIGHSSAHKVSNADKG